MSEEMKKQHTPEMRKKANTYFFSKVAFNFGLIVIGALLVGLFLRNIQTDTSMERQKTNSQLALRDVLSTLDRNERSALELESIFHQGNQQILDDIEVVLSSGLSDTMAEKDNDIRSDIMTTVAERSGADYLFALSKSSQIMMSPDPDLFRINPAVTGLMTQENINAVLQYTLNEDGTVAPVQVKNRFGSFWFYSRPYVFRGEEYALVLGVDSGILDQQTGVLRDLSAVLSRTSVINNGFLFAVGRTDNLFLYFNNGKDMLTGQNALDCGLSEYALEDGYSGFQRIRGQQYYCVSRTVGDRTVICAAAETGEILSDDGYVLFWTILGFNIIMLIFLAYTVIVRNDFVRNEVETDRCVLRKESENPVYFDRSIFRKVFPLMLIAAIAMFGISYYTQTLLEVTQGIEKSETALQEIIGRYEESMENREALSRYNDTHFLSTARLLSFVVEESPDILNADTDKYYSTYDEYGNRIFLTDSEGNRLKSVANSAKLKKLCEANSIDAIYIFDEDGHTIATSTENWFFVISHNEEDQSYPFLQVLLGRIDSYVQERRINDLGEETQLTGAVLHYYTRQNDDGETVYVSRSAYEESAAAYGVFGNTTGDGITEHRSLIQIQLNDTLSDRLLEPTSAERVLTTSMLDGGAVVMFDTSEEHRCLYSPVEASIGKTAAELGIPDNAFTGLDYYGFTRVNGIDYFQYYKYLDDYFFATAIPKASMYHARIPVSVMTSLICLVLLLLLSMTVTLTNKEEEMLYQVMSEEEANEGLNSAIFRIILPSGRLTSTVNAAARWDNRHVTWSEKAPEQKLMDITKVILLLVIIYILLTAAGTVTMFHENSVIRYIMSGSWDRGWNVFALSACAIVLMTAVTMVAVFRIPVRIVTSLLGTRSETLGHLLISIMKYGGALGALFYCLYLVGMDAGGLLASAGVLSLVVGLGAQSLIQDIIAGIFIVFEGEFRVGDIVTIGGYRGTVMDIGLRTTKVMGGDGNIKIFSNSEISGVLNMTKQASVAFVTISIEYGQDIDYVEAVLERELPKLKDKNPVILEGPQYLGISKLGGSGIDIAVMAKCSEKDIKRLIRFLNRELLQIFYRSGINVPFPNITVSQLDMTGRRTLADLQDEQEAENDEI